MPYTPQNATIFAAVYAGALAGVNGSRFPSSSTAADYADFANVAGAFAQEYDTLRGSGATNEFETELVRDLAESVFSGRSPISNARSLLLSNWALLCAAMQSIVTSGTTYLTANSIPNGQEYTIYTPIFTGPGATALGNGTIAGTYLVTGKTCDIKIGFIMGGTTVIGGLLDFPTPPGVTLDADGWPSIAAFTSEIAGCAVLDALGAGTYTAYPIFAGQVFGTPYYNLGTPALNATDVVRISLSLPCQ